MAAPPPFAYRLIQRFFHFLTGLFFAEVEVSAPEHVPSDGGGVVVSWHPNGLVDPGLILTRFPRQVVFGARHGLFKWPILGTLLRRVGTVPIFRAQDAKGSTDEERRAQNARSMDALAAEVARGSFSALFPEGVSHDEPFLRELKTGAARLYYRARQLQQSGAPTPVILPVGLHYDEKCLFRSRAHVCFHPAIELPAELDVTPPEDEPDEVGRERARKLTEEIERNLTDVIHATEDWDTHRVLHRGRKLVRAERAARAGADPGKPRIDERSLGFQRVRLAYYATLKSNPELVATLRKRVESYDDDLRALGIDDHELDRDPKIVRISMAAILALQVLLVFLLLPPILVVGYLVNLPAAFGLWVIAMIGSKLDKDVATVKMLGGMVLFPVTWTGVGVLAAFLHAPLHAQFPSIPDQSVAAGVLVAVLAAVGAVVALRWLRLAGETARAVRVRFTRIRRQRAIDRLRGERGAIFDHLMKAAEGIDLPGAVASDGSIQTG